MTHPTPEGFHRKGTSTLYDGEGNIKQQWVLTRKDSESRIETLLAALETIADPFKAKSKVPKNPKHCLEDLLCIYPMGDPHLGMLATAQTTGAEFDLVIAEENLVSAVDKLVGLAPAAKQALIVNLGDFFHTDNRSNKTLRSGHSLDVDGDWAGLLKVGIRTMRRCIDRACEKHEKVRVINAIGNHDDHSAIMLSLALDQYYSNNPRVEIDTSPMAFHWYRFGVNLIGVTHGNTTKAANLPAVMAHDRKKDWGETKNDCRWFLCGHIHHDTVKEYPGCVVESFRTLAGKDQYTASHGYRSGRDMKCDVLHRTLGKTNRYIVGVEQLAPPEKE
jgi:UDP-2,3-diacylglucosamine pyrophosphatase LpxH